MSQEIASTLRVRAEIGRAPLDTLSDHLREKELLLERLATSRAMRTQSWMLELRVVLVDGHVAPRLMPYRLLA